MIDLTRFSAQDDIRSYLNQPFQEDGHAFATDGVIALMIIGGAEDGMPQAHEKMAGKIPRLIEQTSGYQTVLPLSLKGSRPAKCPECHGKGRITKTMCEDCDGEGEFDHGRHTYTCRECDGIGTDTAPATEGAPGAVFCGECKGSGWLSRLVTLSGDNGLFYTFQEKYLRLALSLPGCRILVGNDVTSAARLEFDGGKGILMPCRA